MYIENLWLVTQYLSNPQRVKSKGKYDKNNRQEILNVDKLKEEQTWW